MTQSVTTNRLGRSTLWTTIATAVNIGLLMLQLAILSRQFPSEIFGQFAVINVFVEIFTALATGGIASYLMYRKDLNQVEKNSVYALAMLFGLFCFLIFSFIYKKIIN